MSAERAIGQLDGSILALRVVYDFTPEQVHAEVGRALKEARETLAERAEEAGQSDGGAAS